MATPSPVYLFKHVKHGIQDIPNYCHQWLSVSFRVQNIRFRSGAPPCTTLGELTTLLQTLAVGSRELTSI